MATRKKAAAKKKAATKKAAKSGGAKVGSAKGRGSKATSKKAAAKKGVVKKAVLGTCKGWKAWHDRMPGGTPTLHVIGVCRFPTHGYKVKLVKAVPQGINPAIRLLRKVVTPPSGPVILVPQLIKVHYREKTSAKLTHVTILPDGVTIKVQQVS